MPELTIDGRPVRVESGTTVMEAAGRLGIHIPGLCRMDGYEPRPSCMLCVVKDVEMARLVPACAALARQGMIVQTGSPEVTDARHEILALLLGNHTGDCEAPCRRACPALLDIPLMTRQVARGDTQGASSTLARWLPLAPVLARICPAPCERTCRRAKTPASPAGTLRDEPLAVREIVRYVSGRPARRQGVPQTAASSGRSVAVVGAGPAGLAAAYYLLLHGHDCTIIDEGERPGGSLRTAIPEAVLPEHILDAAIDSIVDLGLLLKMNTRVEEGITLSELAERYEAVVVTAGDWGESMAKNGLVAEGRVFFAGRPGRTTRLAARSIYRGRNAALAVHRRLGGHTVEAERRRYDSRIGGLTESELAHFRKEAAPHRRVRPAGGDETGVTGREASREAERCMHCDCRKSTSCDLRRCADRFGIATRSGRWEERMPFERVLDHPQIVFEPGKCIKCGRCIRIAERANEPLGIAFTGRGYPTRITVPFGESLAAGLSRAALECVTACPTGALARRDRPL